MNLYLDALPELEDGFRKMAGFATRLSETPENWPQELTSELFKQLPFLSDYDVNVNLDRVEQNRGFAFGYADVANKTERPEVEHKETGLPHIRIPVVVMERAAKPFSVFLNGEKVMPLTEERIREALFNPATFDLSTNPPRDPSLVEATMPPQRSGIGMGGEYKMASAEFSKLSAEERFVYESGLEKSALSKEYAERVARAVGERARKDMTSPLNLLGSNKGVKAIRNVARHVQKSGEHALRRGALGKAELASRYLGHNDALIGGLGKKASPELEKRSFKGDDVVKGGLADKKKPSDFDKKSLKKGSNVESEHTTDKKMAKEIASDHLTEDPKYYEKLDKLEKQAGLRDVARGVAGDARVAAKGVGKAVSGVVGKVKGTVKGAVKRVGDVAKAPAPHVTEAHLNNMKKMKSDIHADYMKGEAGEWRKWHDPNSFVGKHLGHDSVTHPVSQMKDADRAIAEATRSHKDALLKRNIKRVGAGTAVAGGLIGAAALADGGGKDKKSSILLAIAPTISERDADSFTEKVASDASIIAGFKRSGIAPTLVEAFEHTKRASAGDRLDALSESVQPTVVTFQKLPGGDFLVKSANVNAFIEKTAAGEVVPGQEVGQAIGQEQAQAMQPGQTATAVSQPVPEEQVEPEAPSKAKPVEEFGQYKVQDTMGNSVMGHVFPTTLSWDGSFSEQPIALFTNGSAYAMQDSIVGELVGKGTNLPDDEPRGDGAFYTVEGGDAVATGPVTIGSAAAGPDGLPHLQATDSFGNPLQIIQMEGLAAPQRISDSEMAIPSTWKFMRLNNQTQLAGSTEQLGVDQGVQKAASAVTLFFNGSYNFSGGCGLEKISADLRQDLDPVSAEFMLGVLGVDGATAKVKVSEARRKGHVKLANLKRITTMGERYSTSVKTASALLRKMPDLRRDLIKEAAAIQDEGTVDSILSLNFINPENLSTFIEYIPHLEEAAEKLAEMLLYSYLGMKELPEGAVEHAMKGLEEVLVGLKSLAQAEG